MILDIENSSAESYTPKSDLLSSRDLISSSKPSIISSPGLYLIKSSAILHSILFLFSLSCYIGWSMFVFFSPFFSLG
jgi:hypothetical protein